ncbi:hypothetical protein Gbem_4073 [Citrifermentans bemidjiense Bem]|uniref:Uncharacterized protein n=1 Tax=Citrifermentans bemidjiense (strain ATCC BAA-1014 / DSM 16622 / JCM 12645 / Bem) TaxID=404380 RepID=E1P676_CITBB|nr:hypothetical protein Gbem_4073 [Citrifermentans bemidjiense Bem]
MTRITTDVKITASDLIRSRPPVKAGLKVALRSLYLAIPAASAIDITSALRPDA